MMSLIGQKRGGEIKQVNAQIPIAQPSPFTKAIRAVESSISMHLPLI